MSYITQTNYPGVFHLEHFIFLAIVILLIALGLFLNFKVVKQDKTRELILKISGIVLLIMIIANRFSIVLVNRIVFENKSYSWINLIPNTFCGFTSLFLGLTIVIGKKDNPFLNACYPVAFIGGLLSTIYPDYLDHQMFFDPRTITGLIHHAIDIWIVIYALTIKYINPSFKKLPYFFLYITSTMTFGVFLMDALGFESAMQIGKPLISSLPIFTSWYMVGFMLTCLYVGFLFLYPIIMKKLKKA